jgi:uncharacterized membrane protein YqjE
MNIKSSISDYFKIDELKENILKLIEAKFELKKLEIQEKLEGILAGVIVKLALGLFLVMFFIFLNMLLAIGINYLTNTIWAGYAILAAIYLITFLILNTKKDAFEKTVREKIAEAFEKGGV